ncbi:inosine monophosphate dehydrogenase [Aspergillus californicus]
MFKASQLAASAYPWVSAPFIVSAPMRVMSGPALAVAVSRAGGLGFIGPNIHTQDVVADLKEATRLLELNKSTTGSRALLPGPLLPIGVGFQLWADNLEESVASIADFKPCAAWLYAPRQGQKDIDTWSHQIRTVSPRTQIWVQVGTITETIALLKSPERPDVIVIQGAEAGGHGRANDGMGLMALLPEVADLLKDSRIPLFAAGGIADARGTLAALCLGAEGVVLGTRFLATHEARIQDGYRREIVRAGDPGVTTTRTLLYNQLRGTIGWPDGYAPRTIINRSFRDQQEGVPFAELKRLHDRAMKTGDDGWGPDGRLATYAGASIGLIHDVKDAAMVVRDIREEMWRMCPPPVTKL